MMDCCCEQHLEPLRDEYMPPVGHGVITVADGQQICPGCRAHPSLRLILTWVTRSYTKAGCVVLSTDKPHRVLDHWYFPNGALGELFHDRLADSIRDDEAVLMYLAPFYGDAAAELAAMR